jgi:hypothetical protein
MTEDVRHASVEAIKRSGSVLAEVQQEQERIRETLRQSHELDKKQPRPKRSLFRIIADR